VRVALLSAIDTSADAGVDRVGLLPVAGRPIVQHQLECALALGCEKIACHAADFPRELLKSQHIAEKAGAQFQIIQDARALSGMVKAADQLLVFADGLLPDQALANSPFVDRPFVLVLPGDEGVAAGYERIDPEYSWAGVFMVRGDAVERLGALAPDVDPVSALLRIGLQSGIAQQPVPEYTMTGRQWGLVRSQADADTFQKVWLSRHARAANFFAPTLALADRGAAALMSRTAGRKLGHLGILAIAAIFGVAAGIAGWFWVPAAGFALCAVSFLLVRVARSLGRIKMIGRGRQRKRFEAGDVIDFMLDLLLIGLTWVAAASADRIGTLLAAASLILILRLGMRLPLGKWKIFLGDRPLLAAILAASVMNLQFLTVLQALTLIAILAILLDSLKPRITQA